MQHILSHSSMTYEVVIYYETHLVTPHIDRFGVPLQWERKNSEVFHYWWLHTEPNAYGV